MRSSTLNIQCSRINAFRNPKYATRNSSGFAYIALLVIIVIIGISLGAAGKYWGNVMVRDKEEELLFRGDQYRQAIELYYLSIPGRRQYPVSIDDLLKDGRTPLGKRHLRRKFKDPISGEDFVEIKNATMRIIGVHSSSDNLSLKQAGFPITVQIGNQVGVSNTMQVPSQKNDINSMQLGSETDATDATEIASSGTATIKYSDWIFASTIKAGPVGGTPGGVPGGTPGGTTSGITSGLSATMRQKIQELIDNNNQNTPLGTN